MKENMLTELSLEFAEKILLLAKELENKREYLISKQIGKSGTSIGANIHEAQYAQSKSDFVSKFEIALKESSETSYWLKLLIKTNAITETQYNDLESKCAKIRTMLVKSCKTAKNLN
jgi:four helix bundle protein